nr:hypothetical protein [Tanacetum cinerariifolium]
TTLKSYTKDFEKKAQEERKLYIYVVDKSIKDTIKDEVKSLLPQILPKRDRNDKDKDEDPSAGSDRGLKKQKTSKDAEPPKGSKLKESKTSSSKGTKSQLKSSCKFVQVKEPVFETVDTEMPQDQRGDTKDQPKVKTPPMDNWFKKLNKPSTPDRRWNNGKSIDSRPPQKRINNIAKARQPLCTFDELMSTPINFSTYVMHSLKIDNLTQEILVGPAFNLLKGTCKSFVNPLPLNEAQGRQVVPADYFFNNDLKYLKGGSSSRKYTTSTTKNKASKYDNIKGIKDMVLELWSPVKVAYDKLSMWGILHWSPK